MPEACRKLPTYLIGLIGSAFAAGYVAGCLCATRLVASVGHIRVFRHYGSPRRRYRPLSILVVTPIAWVPVRAAAAFAFAGAMMIIESWLSESATSQTKGRVFTRYMVVNLGELGHGPADRHPQ